MNDPRMPRDAIAVTGASGYIGRAVVGAIVRAGNPVLAFSRSDPRIPGAGWVRWDVTQPAEGDVLEAARGVAGVVNAAAMYAPEASYAEHYNVNVEGTRHVIDAFSNARLVHLSTVGVYDPLAPHHRLPETAGPVPQKRYLDPYSKTAGLGERVVGRLKPSAAILRPALVYGEGERYFLPALQAFVHQNTLLLPGGGTHLMTMTHVSTLVSASIAALGRRDATGAFNIGDPEPYVVAQALRQFFRISGREVTIKGLPTSLARVGIRLGRGLGVISRSHPLISRPVLESITRERTYDLRRQAEILGLRPPQYLAPPESQPAS